MAIATSFHKMMSTRRSRSRGRLPRTGLMNAADIFKVSRNPDTYEITITSHVELADYERLMPSNDWRLLQENSQKLAGLTVVFINATMAGGGVAMMRPPLVHLFKLLGIEAHWFVMSGEPDPNKPDPFMFTKKMHNIIQRRLPADEHIIDLGKDTHQNWATANGTILDAQPEIIRADFIVIDDPQPAPLIPQLKKINPHAKIVWRNHVDNDGRLMSDPASPQGEVWSYLLEAGVRLADAFVYHPVDDFVPRGIWDKSYFAPATVDPFDDMNRELDAREIEAGVQFINEQIVSRNQDMVDHNRPQHQQPLIDPARPRIVLIARFDESKGMDKAIELGVMARSKMIDAGVKPSHLPQIMIVGNGSVDDPSGLPIFEQMVALRQDYPEDVRRDIIIARLDHNYAAINALMSASDIGLQTSEAEGLETRVTDWIHHGVPVVVSNRGGIKLQVTPESGCVLDFDKPDYDLERGAEFISKLLLDHKLYAKMRSSTLAQSRDFNNREFTTTANAARWLRIFNDLTENKPADKIWKVSDLAGKN